MEALLVLNNPNVQNLRVIVSVSDQILKNRVINLLEENKGGEALDVLVKEAEVRMYLPYDKPIPRIPFLITLDEELLKSDSVSISTTNSMPRIQKEPRDAVSTKAEVSRR